MTRIVVDAELLKKLRNLSEPLELTDEGGHVLAQVVPAFNPAEWEPWEPPIDEEELQRRERSNEPRYTTEEVLRYLENL
jgi:hypothetical protein